MLKFTSAGSVPTLVKTKAILKVTSLSDILIKLIKSNRTRLDSLFAYLFFKFYFLQKNRKFC